MKSIAYAATCLITSLVYFFSDFAYARHYLKNLKGRSVQSYQIHVCNTLLLLYSAMKKIIARMIKPEDP